MPGTLVQRLAWAAVSAFAACASTRLTNALSWLSRGILLALAPAVASFSFGPAVTSGSVLNMRTGFCRDANVTVTVKVIERPGRLVRTRSPRSDPRCSCPRLPVYVKAVKERPGA